MKILLFWLGLQTVVTTSSVNQSTVTPPTKSSSTEDTTTVSATNLTEPYRFSTTVSETTSNTTVGSTSSSISGTVTSSGTNTTNVTITTTTATITTTSIISTQSTFFGVGGAGKETNVKSGAGGVYDYGSGNRYAGGYDERDGETMMTTSNNGMFDGDNMFAPVPKPTPPKHTEPPINTKTAESTAYVVLVTSATLIIIVLIILLVLKIKYRTDTNRYKIEMPKSYGNPIEQTSDRSGLCNIQQQRQHQQHNIMLSPGNYTSSRQSSPTLYVQQSNYRPHSDNSGGMNNKPKKRQDVKEWYV